MSKTRTVLAVAAVLAVAGWMVDDDETAAPTTSEKPVAVASPAPNPAPIEVTYKTVRITKSIPFSRDVVKTSALDAGVTRVDDAGRPGVRVRVVRVAMKDGVEVGRDVVKTFVQRAPSSRVTLVGTREKPKPKPSSPSCDPNYSGACVPVASDVDCAGGSGDGPAYVQGPVRVVGDDVYDLNRDDDDIACDS